MNKIFIALLSLVLLALPAAAAFEENAAGARPQAMVGAFTAVADSAETLFLQPAGLTLLKAPALSLTYGKLFTGLSDGSELNDGAIAIAAPVSDRVAFGFGYKNAGLASVYREETGILGAAWRPLAFLSAGVNVKYLRVTYGEDQYTAVDPVFSAGNAKTGIDYDAGIFLRLSRFFNLAWSRQNIAAADLGLKETAPAATADRLGLTYADDSFTMTVESVKTAARYRFLSAVEKWFLHRSLAVRLGIGWGDREFRKAAAGLGVSFDRFTVDYALEYPLSGIEQTNGTHYVTIGVRFDGRKPKESAGSPVAVSSGTATAVYSTATVSGSEVSISSDVYYGPLSSTTYAAGSSSSTLRTAIESYLLGLTSPTVSASTAAAHGQKILPPVQQKKKIAPKPEPLHQTIVPVRVYSAPAEHGLKTHRTVAGDTLPGLAERYYGKKSLWIKIYEANRDRIEKGALRPGEILIIPVPEE